LPREIQEEWCARWRRKKRRRGRSRWKKDGSKMTAAPYGEEGSYYFAPQAG